MSTTWGREYKGTTRCGKYKRIKGVENTGAHLEVENIGAQQEVENMGAQQEVMNTRAQQV